VVGQPKNYYSQQGKSKHIKFVIIILLPQKGSGFFKMIPDSGSEFL